MALRNKNRPVDEGIHEAEDMCSSVEHAEVESSAGVGSLLWRRHAPQHDRFETAVIGIDVRVVQMREGPTLDETAVSTE